MALRANVVLAAMVAFVVLAPAASAHTTVLSADNKVRASVGLLNEPVVVDATTGLDVCFTQANAARTPIYLRNPDGTRNNTLAGHFKAVLTAPGGKTYTSDVVVPFGRDNCITFDAPLSMSRPGQYYVDLTMNTHPTTGQPLLFNGTTFSQRNIIAGGLVLERGAVSFPDASVPSANDTAAHLARLEARIAQLEAEQAAAPAGNEDQFAPGVPAVVLLGVVALAAGLRRRW